GARDRAQAQGRRRCGAGRAGSVVIRSEQGRVGGRGGVRGVRTHVRDGGEPGSARAIRRRRRGRQLNPSSAAAIRVAALTREVTAMRIASKRHTAVAMAATATLVVSACGGQGSADVDAETLNAMSVEELAEAAKGEEVYWLTTMYPTETAQKVADAFTAKYPGITVQVDRKKEAGYVDCYLPESAKDLDKKYLDPNGCWFAARESVFTLAYNTDKVDPADVPKSYLDLADPKWRGKIGMLDPALSNNVFSAYFTMSRKIGNGDLDATKDYWQKVGANKPVLYKEGGALINAVASGEVAVVWVFDYRAWELKDSGAPVALATPKEGV